MGGFFGVFHLVYSYDTHFCSNIPTIFTMATVVLDILFDYVFTLISCNIIKMNDGLGKMRTY